MVQGSIICENENIVNTQSAYLMPLHWKHLLVFPHLKLGVQGPYISIDNCVGPTPNILGEVCYSACALWVYPPWAGIAVWLLELQCKKESFLALQTMWQVFNVILIKIKLSCCSVGSVASAFHCTFDNLTKLRPRLIHFFLNHGM